MRYPRRARNRFSKAETDRGGKVVERAEASARLVDEIRTRCNRSTGYRSERELTSEKRAARTRRGVNSPVIEEEQREERLVYGKVPREWRASGAKWSAMGRVKLEKRASIGMQMADRPRVTPMIERDKKARREIHLPRMLSFLFLPFPFFPFFPFFHASNLA